jgi:MOSC domain-containing protein YiiM
VKPPEKPVVPAGDPSRHLARNELDAELAMLPPAPRDRGTLVLIVRRLSDHSRETPDRVMLTPKGGVTGDNWARRLPLNPDAQIAVMRRDVAELMANGQSLTLFGDNLFVDLDISAAAQPPGARFRVGGAVVEVTPKPHNGCRQFAQRFGHDALRLTADPATRHLNLRGIYWKVVEAGEITVGDAISLLAR